MKNLYVWLNTHMKVFSICWLLLALPTAVFPGLFVPTIGFVVLVALFFFLGDYVTGWWDEVKGLF